MKFETVCKPYFFLVFPHTIVGPALTGGHASVHSLAMDGVEGEARRWSALFDLLGPKNVFQTYFIEFSQVTKLVRNWTQSNGKDRAL